MNEKKTPEEKERKYVYTRDMRKPSRKGEGSENRRTGKESRGESIKSANGHKKWPPKELKLPGHIPT